MDARLAQPLEPLAEAWRAEVRPRRRRAIVALGALVTVTALLVARYGTDPMRLLSAGILAGTAAAALGLDVLERRRWGQPARVIQRLAGNVDPDRAGRAVRAITLLDRENDAGTSRELTLLHVTRSLAALPRERILEGASRLAYALGIAALVLGSGAAVLGFTNFWGLLEGADVLVARRGVAPFDMRWFVDLEISARPPDYLHDDERDWGVEGRLSVPRGTLLTVHGVAVHTGRRLSLSDGMNEVPFVDDGTGRLVARWPVTESVELRALARFGDVVVEDPEVVAVRSIADLAPIVTLEDAPRRVVLSTEGTSDIPIRYEALDDHGLREVQLVLREGTREERRVLAKLDGETRFDRGGHVLRATDSFFKKSHGPIEVSVEAKDNDPITGPKWGASPAITVIPPDVGEPEAHRLDGLRKLRDAVVDALGWRLANDVPSKVGARAAFLTEELKGIEDDAELLDATLSTSYVGLRIPGRLQALLRGQMRKVREAANHEVHAPSVVTHAALVHATERLTLVIDGLVRGLGQRDARESAHKLADVADDLALGASQMQRATDRERGAARTDAAALVLEGGKRSLERMGSLGLDLGEIVRADLARVARSRQADDAVHAEIAARDLAARLREPDPSFGAHGHSRRTGAGEDDEGSDDAEQAFEMAAQELGGLVTDHAEELGKVEEALGGAVGDDDLKAFGEEAKKHADAVREATKELPTVGSTFDSWTNKGAAGREEAEAMARSLEQANPADAVTRGHRALDAIDEAKRMAQHERWADLLGPIARDPNATDADKRLDDARQKLQPEVKWAEERLAQLRKRASERKGGELSSDGDEEEKLADRARALADKGEGQGLPDPAIESLGAASKAAHEAAESLKRGEGDKGLERQHEAQRSLEAARDALGNDSGDSGGDGGDHDAFHPSPLDIPGADTHKGPEDFRRRVLHGLGQAANGKQQDAVRRYADGLLR